MRIVLVPSSFLPRTGGLENVTAQLAQGLQARGHTVTVVTPRYPRTLPVRETVNGIPVTRLDFIYPRWRDVQRGRADLFAAGLVYFPLTLCRLLWLLARFRPDAVNLHFVGSPALFVRLAQWVLRVWTVVSLHGDDVAGLARGTGWDRRLFFSVCGAADTVTACSAFLLREAIPYAPGVAAHGMVAYNGMALPQVEGQTEPGLLVASGRLVPKKGFDLLLYALARLPELRLILVGDGPERAALERLTAELGLGERVRLAGALPHGETLQQMARAEMIVIPSRQEGFGLVAAEALALGKPVVAARVGGLPEVLADAHAVLVEPDNAAALAEGMQQIHMRLAHEPAFGAANRARAERFTLAQMVETYLRAYAGAEA